jgi:Uma2 family endonuclease
MSHEMDTSRPSSDHPDLLYSKGDMEAAIVQDDAAQHDLHGENVAGAGVTEYRFTAEQFELMVSRNIFDDERVELIDGRLIDMPPPDAPHDGIVTAFDKIVQAAIARRGLVRPQMALPAGRMSVPVPDVSIVRWDDGYYRDRRPSPDETFAVVEVSNSTLAFDRDVKRRIYGAARIPEYWIVDVRKKRIHVHREPHDLGYGAEEVREQHETVSFAAFPDVVLSVADLVG